MNRQVARVGLLVGSLISAASGQLIGPSTAGPCYVLPVPQVSPTSVVTQALLTTGDSIGGYRMVGIPDGLGLLGDTTQATLMMNHELGATAGIVRAHGSPGAFVSRWTINPLTRAITAGCDHSTSPLDVHAYDIATGAWLTGTVAWDRFCSADLAAPSAFEFNGLGTQTRLFLNGEESAGQRAWAHVVTGSASNQSFQLPHLGRAAYENLVASPFPQQATVVIGLDDAGLPNTALPSEVYVYVGRKQSTGNDIERAGLVGGGLYGIRVHAAGSIVPSESNGFALGSSYYVNSGMFELVSLGDASLLTASDQHAAAIALQATQFQRCEDGCWDPRPGFQNDFYFATTGSPTLNSRIWKLHFHDITQPKLGGIITALLVGNEGHMMLDNVTIDQHGRLFAQEDHGSSAPVGRIWIYDLVTQRFFPITQQNPAMFLAGGASFVTTDDESSGIIPAFGVLGDGWYFLTCQNHAPSSDPELVQGGQLLALYVEPDLGRHFSFWFSSPLGAGSIALNHAFGTPGASAFTAVTLSQGMFPTGWFSGIDIAVADVVAQANFGAPFVTALDGFGAAQSQGYVIGLSGTTFYGVALNDIWASSPSASHPVAYVIP